MYFDAALCTVQLLVKTVFAPDTKTVKSVGTSATRDVDEVPAPF